MDVVVCLGGDEFGQLLKSCPLSKGVSIAESICRYVLEWDEMNLN